MPAVQIACLKLELLQNLKKSKGRFYYCSYYYFHSSDCYYALLLLNSFKAIQAAKKAAVKERPQAGMAVRVQGSFRRGVTEGMETPTCG